MRLCILMHTVGLLLSCKTDTRKLSSSGPCILTETGNVLFQHVTHYALVYLGTEME